MRAGVSRDEVTDGVATITLEILAKARSISDNVEVTAPTALNSAPISVWR